MDPSRRTSSRALIGLGSFALAGLAYLVRDSVGQRGPASFPLEFDFGVGTVAAADVQVELAEDGRVALVPDGQGAAPRTAAGTDPAQVPQSAAEGSQQAAMLGLGLERPAGPTPGAPDERDARELERRARLSRHYAVVPLEALVEQHRRLSRELGMRINQEASESFARGDGVAPGPEEQARDGYDRWGQMVRYSCDPTGHKIRVQLREEDHPKLYDMKRELDWLYGEVRRRKQSEG